MYGQSEAGRLPSPFRNIFRLSVGDAAAKTLNFLAFVWLARVLGVSPYGVLEFANSLLVYFLLMGDAGLEIWATREAARTDDLRRLAGRILPLRLLLAVLAFAILLLALPTLPAYPQVRMVLALFGLSLFAQAANLKWAFLGKEEMARVAWGLVVAQIVFALLVFGLVRSPAGLVAIPLFRLASDAALAVYFAVVFVRAHGSPAVWVMRGAGEILRPALTIGIAQALGLLNYNFDSILLGFLTTAQTVGWYSAAYKPVTMALALPLTYFTGLFPALSRAHGESAEALRALVERSLRLCSLYAVPLALGGSLLAAPIIALLFGPAYAESARVLPLLIWSAVFVVMRGSYRHALTAAGHQAVDLRCAMVSTTLNVGLNLLLIPRYGMIGAATATIVGDFAWFVLAWWLFQRKVMPLPLLPALARPLAAGAAMAAVLWFAQPLFWMARGAAALALYGIVLLLLGEPELRKWTRGK
jgi:O-antigen/teichoic acid export membrane protein